MKTLTVEFIPHTSGKNYNPGSPGSMYDYLYTGKKDVKPGDWALVHNGFTFGITKVALVKPGISAKVAKHALAIITQNDFEGYEAANKRIHEYRGVFDQLDFRLAEKKRLSKYEELAATDPVARDLLDQLKSFQGAPLELETMSKQVDVDFDAVPEGQATTAAASPPVKAGANEAPEGIPLGVYFNGYRLYDAFNHQPIDEDTQKKWEGRMDAFPTDPNVARLKLEAVRLEATRTHGVDVLDL